MEKMLISFQIPKINVVETDRMETLPMGTILFCSADELRNLASLMDNPRTTVDELRKAALNLSQLSGGPAKRKAQAGR